MGRIHALLALALFALPAASRAGEEPAAEPTAEARALVEKARALQQGPPTLLPLETFFRLQAIVGGKGGEAAVRLELRLRIGANGHGVGIEGPTSGDLERHARAAAQPVNASVDFLCGGILPFPWDRWQGSVGKDGVLHAAFPLGPERWGGVEATFDGKGLPVSAWALQGDHPEGLRRTARIRLRWEPAGERFRLVEVEQEGMDGRPLLHVAYASGPGDEPLPRTWTVRLEDRVVRFARKGFYAASLGLAGDNGWVMSYAIDPAPERLLEVIRDGGDALLPPKEGESDRGDLFSVALGAVLRAEPSLLPKAVECLAVAGPGPGRVLLRAIARSTDRDRGKALEEVRGKVHESVRPAVDALKAGLADPLHAAIDMTSVLEGAAGLDRCWYLYFVSGDPAALRPVVGALRGLDSKDKASIIVGGAARWSLTSNVAQVPAVRECLVRDLPILPEELREHVHAILDAKPPKDGK